MRDSVARLKPFKLAWPNGSSVPALGAHNTYSTILLKRENEDRSDVPELSP